MKSFWAFLLICLPILGYSKPPTPLGTSFGNFDRRFEKDFDFQIAHPKDWEFLETELNKGDLVRCWGISNEGLVNDKSRESQLTIIFGINESIESADALMDYALEKHPEVEEWSMNTVGDIISVKSGDLPVSKSASRSLEYYLPIKKQFVFVETRKDEFKNGAATVDLILSTIARASKPPSITSLSILKTTQGSFDAGDELCYKIEVDDFAGSLVKSSLLTFDYRKENIYFTRKSISFDEENHRYLVCTQVRANHSPEDLLIKSLQIHNRHGQGITCEAKSETPLALVCDSGENHVIELPPLNIKYPDTSPPKLIHAYVTKNPPLLHLKVEDQSPMGGAVIKFENDKILNIFADQFTSDEISMPIDYQSDFGWNKITAMGFFDENGERVVFKLEEEGGRVPATYTEMSAAGSKTSDIEIIHYFLDGGRI